MLGCIFAFHGLSYSVAGRGVVNSLARQKIAIAEKSLPFSDRKAQIASFAAEIYIAAILGGCGINKNRSVAAFFSKSQRFQGAKVKSKRRIFSERQERMI